MPGDFVFPFSLVSVSVDQINGWISTSFHCRVLTLIRAFADQLFSRWIRFHVSSIFRSLMSLLPLTSSYFQSLDRIDPHLLERFERAGIKTLTDLALFSPLELSLKFRLTLNDAEHILQQLFSRLGVQAKNAYELLVETTAQASFLPTKLPSLNRYLNGGLRRGSLVELCGSWGELIHRFRSFSKRCNSS